MDGIPSHNILAIQLSECLITAVSSYKMPVQDMYATQGIHNTQATFNHAQGLLSSGDMVFTTLEVNVIFNHFHTVAQKRVCLCA